MARGIWFTGGRGTGSGSTTPAGGGRGSDSGAVVTKVVSPVASPQPVVTGSGGRLAEKGFEFFPTAQRAERVAQATDSRQDLGGLGSTAEVTNRDLPKARPRLSGYILVNGHSLAALEHLKLLVHELDAAAQSRVALRAIGDPSHSGEFSKGLMSVEERAALPVQASRYVQRIVKEGHESFHVVEHSREQARLLGIPIEELPCIAFFDTWTNVLLSTTRIEPEWYETELARRAFGRALEAWFMDPVLVEALNVFNEGQADAGGITAEILKLGQTVGLAVVRVTGNRELIKRLACPDTVRMRLDTGTQSAYFHKAAFDLAPMDFRFLLELAKRPGEFVSLDEIIVVASPMREIADVIPWGRNHRHTIIKALWSLRETGSLPQSREELSALIEGKGQAYRLNLTPEEIWVR
jgi:hypothetical protein